MRVLPTFLSGTGWKLITGPPDTRGPTRNHAAWLWLCKGISNSAPQNAATRLVSRQSIVTSPHATLGRLMRPEDSRASSSQPLRQRGQPELVAMSDVPFGATSEAAASRLGSGALFATVYGVAPIALSRLASRHGWPRGNSTSVAGRARRLLRTLVRER